MKLEMDEVDEAVVKSQITYRINAMKQKTTMMYERMKDVMGIV